MNKRATQGANFDLLRNRERYPQDRYKIRSLTGTESKLNSKRQMRFPITIPFPILMDVEHNTRLELLLYCTRCIYSSHEKFDFEFTVAKL